MIYKNLAFLGGILSIAINSAFAMDGEEGGAKKNLPRKQTFDLQHFVEKLTEEERSSIEHNSEGDLLDLLNRKEPELSPTVARVRPKPPPLSLDYLGTPTEQEAFLLSREVLSADDLRKRYSSPKGSPKERRSSRDAQYNLSPSESIKSYRSKNSLGSPGRLPPAVQDEQKGSNRSRGSLDSPGRQVICLSLKKSPGRETFSEEGMSYLSPLRTRKDSQGSSPPVFDSREREGEQTTLYQRPGALKFPSFPGDKIDAFPGREMSPETRFSPNRDESSRRDQSPLKIRKDSQSSSPTFLDHYSSESSGREGSQSPVRQRPGIRKISFPPESSTELEDFKRVIKGSQERGQQSSSPSEEINRSSFLSFSGMGSQENGVLQRNRRRSQESHPEASLKSLIGSPEEPNVPLNFLDNFLQRDTTKHKEEQLLKPPEEEVKDSPKS